MSTLAQYFNHDRVDEARKQRVDWLYPASEIEFRQPDAELLITHTSKRLLATWQWVNEQLAMQWSVR